jgi:hypothetical protein
MTHKEVRKFLDSERIVRKAWLRAGDKKAEPNK